MAHFPDVLAPFVPTPHDVVERMLLLAAVNARDVVYDVGCGDARILIAAALRYGARGVGIDAVPYHVEEARAAVAGAGVGHLVDIRLQDAQTADLSPASVVMLYLMPWSTQKFRPIIASAAKPGTRVVSHNFPMGDWEPAKIEKLNDAQGIARTLYLWVTG